MAFLMRRFSIKTGGRVRRCVEVCSSAGFALVVSATAVLAYDAELVWDPVSDAAGYNVYVRYDDQAFGQPVDLGSVKKKSDGRLHAVVTDLPLGPTARFAVSAYDEDGNEGGKSNERTIRYTKAATVVDSDGDGLSDAEEDLNLNQKVDSGETDPNDADTDGDGTKDGIEVASGRDPLKADSAPYCGNGRVDDGEACDDGNSNPDDGCLSDCTSAACTPATAADDCNDGDVCTTERCVDGFCDWRGNSESCDDGIACTSGDRCSGGVCRGTENCGAGEFCNVERDTCESQEPVCGNGRRESGEACDDGNSNPDDGCLSDCSIAECTPNNAERDCDDGNVCTTERCVDGTCDWNSNSESCDDGISCTHRDRCGGGVCRGTEDCGGGEFCNVERDACESQEPVCGNGRREDGEACDDGNSNPDDGCLSDCSTAECTPGNAERDCDDGNVCTTERCVDGTCDWNSNSESCDDGIACTSGDRCSQGACAGYDDCGKGEVCHIERDMCEPLLDEGQVWVPAATFPAALFKGTMTTSDEFSSGADSDASADALVPAQIYPDSQNDAYDAGSGDETQYTISLPESGRWYLWGRFYYPGADDEANSFFVTVDDRDPLPFGNNRDFYRQWHWDGDGDIESGKKRPVALGYLDAGRHTITISKRESGDQPPLIDVLHLTRSPDRKPDDQVAAAVLAECPDGSCGGGFERARCGDTNGNGELEASDAVAIIRAAIGLNPGCTLASCDVNLDGKISAGDAILVLTRAVGGDVVLECSDKLGIVLTQPAPLKRIKVELFYDGAPIVFDSEPKCTPVGDLADSGFRVMHEQSEKRLVFTIKYATPVTEEQKLVECGFRTPRSSRTLPAPASIMTSVLSFTTPDGKAPTLAPQVSPTFLIP